MTGVRGFEGIVVVAVAIEFIFDCFPSFEDEVTDVDVDGGGGGGVGKDGVVVG